MDKPEYTLEEMLASFSTYKKPKAKKRLLFDQSPLGGIGSKWIILFFILLPLIEYAGIFNPFMFGMLGIAQAIIFYVIFLSMIMILIFALAFINNTKVIRDIASSWEHYFIDIDINSYSYFSCVTIIGALVGDRTGDPASLACVDAPTGRNTTIKYCEPSRPPPENRPFWAPRGGGRGPHVRPTSKNPGFFGIL